MSEPLALVMAAGLSRRFGTDKRWMVLHSGNTLLEQVFINIAAAHLPMRPVVRIDEPRLTTYNWPAPPLLIDIDDAERGLGASIAAATRQLSDEQSVLICLGDMPYINSTIYRSIAAAIKRQRIVVPVYNFQRGHPVGFAACYLPELRCLNGDGGARALLLQHSDCVQELAVHDSSIHRDIDTVADLLLGH